MRYQEKLKDPRWQRKRLEIFQRDKWKCTECGRDDLELQVHHENYHGEPWKTPNEFLKTLCATCHACISTGIDFSETKLQIRGRYVLE